MPKKNYTETDMVEAALFTAARPVTPSEVAKASRLELEEVKASLEELEEDYTSRNGALEVCRIGPKWAMKTREGLEEEVIWLASAEIPEKLLQTVALIAYHQPILQSKLVEMIGTKVYEDIKDLRSLGLVRAKPKSHSLELTVTNLFLEKFGIKARNRDELREMLAARMEQAD